MSIALCRARSNLIGFVSMKEAMNRVDEFTYSDFGLGEATVKIIVEFNVEHGRMEKLVENSQNSLT